MEDRKKACKKNKHIFVCSENGNCRIKGTRITTNITDELEAVLFFKSREWRPQGMHCTLVIHQLFEYPNPLLCSPPFFYFITLTTYCLFVSSNLYLQHRSPSCCLKYLPCNFMLPWLAAKMLLSLKYGSLQKNKVNEQTLPWITWTGSPSDILKSSSDWEP